MTPPEPIVLAGRGRVDFEPVVPRTLEQIIYSAASTALADAGTSIRDVDAISMASSDLLDGRAISTMTLTGSTGSLQKSEMRVCSDGLVAMALAASELGAGLAERVLVGAWSKLSEGTKSLIDPLSVEPFFHRPLGLTPAAVHAARVSTVAAPPAPKAQPQVGDGAVAFLLCAESLAGGRRRGALLGLGWNTGPYLEAEVPPLDSVARAIDRACATAGLRPGDLAGTWTSGFHDVDDEDLRGWCRLGGSPLHRAGPQGVEIGYAAGLNAVYDALAAGDGPWLVIAATGAGYQAGCAVVVSR